MLLRDPKNGKIFGSNKNHVSKPLNIRPAEENFETGLDISGQDLAKIDPGDNDVVIPKPMQDVPTHTSTYVLADSADIVVDIHSYAQTDSIPKVQTQNSPQGRLKNQ